MIEYFLIFVDYLCLIIIDNLLSLNENVIDI